MSRNTVRRLLSIPGVPRTTVSEQDTIDESLLILARIVLAQAEEILGITRVQN